MKVLKWELSGRTYLVPAKKISLITENENKDCLIHVVGLVEPLECNLSLKEIEEELKIQIQTREIPEHMRGLVL